MYVALSLVFLVIFYQDVKNRTIHVLLLIILFVLGLITNYCFFGKGIEWLYNLGFVGVNLIGITIYFSLKHKKFINPIDYLIGLGDILFFIAITPFFLIREYIVFFTLSLIFSLVLYYLVRIFKVVNTIPLAGYMSIFFIANIISERLLGESFLFEDLWI
jgi:hypothetical protein